MSNAKEKTSTLRLYDGYEYHNFWVGRDYEDQVERIALRHLLPEDRGKIIDLGSNYGRLTGEYESFHQVILCDEAYSAIAQAKTEWNHPRYLHVVCELQHTPFSDAFTDVVICIRTLHHMSDIALFFAEARRILRPGGILIFEFANKRNLKQITLSAIGKSQRQLNSIAPSPVGETIRNFHPQHILHLLAEFGFRIEEVRGVSNLRHDIPKKLIPLPMLIWMDACVQGIAGKLFLSPSIFLKVRKD